MSGCLIFFQTKIVRMLLLFSQSRFVTNGKLFLYSSSIQLVSSANILGVIVYCKLVSTFFVQYVENKCKSHIQVQHIFLRLWSCVCVGRRLKVSFSDIGLHFSMSYGSFMQVKFNSN